MISISSLVFTFPIVPPDIQYRYSFKTDFEPTIRGSEGRVVRWGEYRLSLSFPEMPLREDELNTLKSFHSARGGKLEGFLVKVPDNYALGTSQGRLLPLDGTNTLFQIVRVHSVGSVKTYKPIRYPLSGTTRVFVNGVEAVSGWLVNTSTGRVQFSTAQTGTLTVSCEFYTPMRFDNDTIEGIQVSGGQDDLFRYIENPSHALIMLRGQVGAVDPIYQVSGLTLKEVHIPITKSFYSPSDFTAIATDFSYPIVPQNVRTTEKRVELEDSPAGVENVVARDSQTITRYLSTGVENDELDYLLNYFLVAKGRAISFNGRRFDVDEFSYTRTSPSFAIASDIPLISCPEGNRRYQVFGRYLSKYTSDFGNSQNHPSCGSIRYWRTIGPITFSPLESVANIEVRRTVQVGADGSRWVVAKKDAGSSGEIDLWDIGENYQAVTPDDKKTNYDLKFLDPENLPPTAFGLFIGYQNKASICNGGGETPSFPRGDDFVITDIVEITDNPIGSPLPYATILKITRDDGVIKSYTSWDSNLTIDGITYFSNSGIIPTAVSEKSDMSADNLEVSTFFDDITDLDIVTGKYNQASVEAFVVDVSDLSKEPISLFGGEIGQITAGDTRFTFELRSKSTRLNQAISVRTSDQCENTFCDSRCGLDIDDYTTDGFTVDELRDSTYAQRAFTVDPWPSTSDFTDGLLEFTSGQLEGVRLEVKQVVSGGEIQLWSNLPVGIAAGDTLKLIRGCPKTPDACKVFGNFVNFNGFLVGGNWMVGDDALLSGD